MRNSLLVAPMPTASTSQILGNNECFEPFTSNLYSRRTNAGEFVLPNKYLMNELIEMGLWNEKVKDNIILNKGSIQHMTDVSDHLKEKYKTVWEIPMKHLIDMAADRAPYICQSQSLNLWLEDPEYKTLTSMHFYAWEKGLKTGIYYLRRKAKHQAQQFTIKPPTTTQADEDKNKERVNITEKFLNYIKKDDASTVKTYSNDNPSMIYSNVRHRDVIQYIEDMQMIPDDTGDRALINHIKEMSENLPDNKFKVVLRTLKETSKTWFLEELDKKNIEYNKYNNKSSHKFTI